MLSLTTTGHDFIAEACIETGALIRCPRCNRHYVDAGDNAAEVAAMAIIGVARDSGEISLHGYTDDEIDKAVGMVVYDQSSPCPEA